jgi:hypothetical protein
MLPKRHHATAHFAESSKLRDLDMNRMVPELGAAADGSGLRTPRRWEILRLCFTEQCARGVMSFPPHIGLCDGECRVLPERGSAVLQSKLECKLCTYKTPRS